MLFVAGALCPERMNSADWMKSRKSVGNLQDLLSVKIYCEWEKARVHIKKKKKYAQRRAVVLIVIFG